MHNLGFALEGAGRVLAVCLVLGAGLPALFTVGIRVLAYGAGQAEVHASGVSGPTRRPAAIAAGYACFAIVLLAVVLGIAFIVLSGFGKTVSFEPLPAIVSK